MPLCGNRQMRTVDWLKVPGCHEHVLDNLDVETLKRAIEDPMNFKYWVEDRIYEWVEDEIKDGTINSFYADLKRDILRRCGR